MNEIAHDLHTVIATALPKCPRCEALRRDIKHYDDMDRHRAAYNARHRLSKHRADNDDVPCTERPQTDWKAKAEELLKMVHQYAQAGTEATLALSLAEDEIIALRKKIEELKSR